MTSPASICRTCDGYGTLPNDDQRCPDCDIRRRRVNDAKTHLQENAAIVSVARTALHAALDDLNTPQAHRTLTAIDRLDDAFGDALHEIKKMTGMLP